MKRGLVLLVVCAFGCGARSDLDAGKDDGVGAPGSDPAGAPASCPSDEPGRLLMARVVNSPFVDNLRVSVASDEGGELFLLLKNGRNPDNDVVGAPKSLQLLKVDTRGRTSWSVAAGSEPRSFPWGGALAVNLDGSAVVISPSSEPGDSRPTLVKLSGRGKQTSKTQLTKNVGGWAPLSVGADATGGTVLLGLADNSVDVGGGALATAAQEFFVAKLDATTAHVWSHAFGGPVSQVEMDVAPDGTLTLAGELQGRVVFGEMTFESANQAPFVAALSPDGAPLFSKLFQSAQSTTLHGVARDPSGSSYLALSFSDTLDLGTQTLTAPHDFSFALIKLDPAGELAWARVVGSVDSAAIDASKPDELVLTAAFRGPVDLGYGALTAHPQGIFVASLTAQGEPRWFREMPSASDQFNLTLDVARGPCESIAVAACLMGSLDTGAGRLTSHSRTYPSDHGEFYTTWFGTPMLLGFER